MVIERLTGLECRESFFARKYLSGTYSNVMEVLARIDWSGTKCQEILDKERCLKDGKKENQEKLKKLQYTI